MFPHPFIHLEVGRQRHAERLAAANRRRLAECADDAGDRPARPGRASFDRRVPAVVEVRLRTRGETS